MVAAIDRSSHTTHDLIWLVSYFGFKVVIGGKYINLNKITKI